MPSGIELYDGLDEYGNTYTEIEDRISGTWRWGTVNEAVYKRDSDGTHWMMTYMTQTDDGIQWDTVEVKQVRPVEKTVVVTEWEPVK
jgi:hypothetical protein